MWYAFRPPHPRKAARHEPKQNRAGQDLNDGKTRPSCVLLHKIARLPAACVNISLCVCVCVCASVCTELWADDCYDSSNMCDGEHTETHAAQSVECRARINPTGGMLPVVIVNMAGSCLRNVCSTLLNSLARLHRKWRTKIFSPALLRLERALTSSAAYKLSACLWSQLDSLPQRDSIRIIAFHDDFDPVFSRLTLSLSSLLLSSFISRPTVRICVMCFYSLATEAVLFQIVQTNRDKS